MTYRVETFTGRGTRQTYSEDCAKLADATRIFMREARFCHGAPDDTVLLLRAHDDRRGTVLAHRSTDSAQAIFEPAYFDAFNGGRR